MNENDILTMQVVDPSELENVEGGGSAADYAGAALILGGVATGCPLAVYVGLQLAPWW